MDLFNLFDALISDSEEDRKQAFDVFEELFEDPHLYDTLFDMLSTENLDQKYYILASECLLTWFKRSGTKIDKSEQIPFIQKIQSFLLCDHPAQKEIWHLYSVTFNCYAHEIIFVKFLGDSIDLISLQTQPEVLSLVLKLSSLTSYKVVNNLDKSIKEYFEQLFTEINNRLVIILQNAQELLSSSIGCSVIRYSFETIFYSTRRCQFNSDLFPLIIETLHLILQNFSNIEDSEFCQLVGFCYRMINMFKYNSSNRIMVNLNLSGEQIESINEETNSLILQFVASLAPYHLECIHNFLLFLKCDSSLIPETSDFIQVILEIATLTETDLNDYYENPHVFYGCAYPTKAQDSETRRIIYDLVEIKCHQSKTYEIVKNLISQPPSEASLYLIASIIGNLMLSDSHAEEVFQFIAECANQEVPFQSPLMMSTFLFLVSKIIGKIAPDEFIDSLAPLVYKIVVLSVMDEDDIKNDFDDESNSYSAQKEFVVECSKSLVTVTNAVRVAKKMIVNNTTEFPPEMLFCVIKLIPCFPTSDAAKFIRNFINMAHSNPEKEAFFMSQVETMKLNLCEAAMAAISRSSEFQGMLNISSFQKNEELNDFEIISNILETLNQIIICEGETPIITDEMVILIETLFPNFDNVFSNQLNEIVITLIKLEFDGSPHIMGVLTEAIESTHNLFYHLDEFYFMYLNFMIEFRDTFIEMNMAPTVAMFGVETIKANPIISQEEIGEKLSRGLDLICFSIQTDPNFDVSPFVQFVEEQSQDDSDFFNTCGIMIMMSIVVSRPQAASYEELLNSILEWALGGNAECPYSKRLTALSLMILGSSDDVMKVAIELLSQEKEQRAMLAQLAKSTCHCYPTPIEKINLEEIVQNAVSRCSPEIAKNINSILDL